MGNGLTAKQITLPGISFVKLNKDGKRRAGPCPWLTATDYQDV